MTYHHETLATLWKMLHQGSYSAYEAQMYLRGMAQAYIHTSEMSPACGYWIALSADCTWLCAIVAQLQEIRQ